MPFKRYCFLISLLLNIGLAFSQNKASAKISYGDSAIYYAHLSYHPHSIDTLLLYKAFEMANHMDIKSEEGSIDKINALSKELRARNANWFADRLDEVLIHQISRSDSLPFAIKKCKKFIDSYALSRAPVDRFIALQALLELRIPLRTKSIPEAFDYYSSQLQLQLKRKDSTSIAICYFCLGSIYKVAGLIDMTIYNFKKSTSYINKKDTASEQPLSGLWAWVNNTSAIGAYSIEVGDYKTAIDYSREARYIRINTLKDHNVSYLNCNIAYAHLMLNELDSVEDLLNNSIRIASLSQDYPSLARAYEIKGQYFIALHQTDSAEVNLLKCRELMLTHNILHFNGAGTQIPYYYLAKVRIMQNRYKDARTLLEQELTELSNNKKEIIKEQKLLLEVYNKLGDSEAADSTFKKYSDMQLSLYNEERKNRLKSFEVEEKISASERTIDDLVTEKRLAELTKKYLIGIAGLLLLVALIIFNRFRVTRKQKIIIEKEKQRSEELLLNILPSEVAEELKDKGRAEAKHFDMVTVLFTDFKGFTQLSEKLSPAALIAEINECFSAFDLIMQKYRIEKIKTIGDAYMAAGGLPVSNKTNAEDVVNAGMEIQKFMHEYKMKKEAAGELFFEIRIGIHSGPVVAGIVGIKKFAYDIWGDTVNIASRMESSGEVNKINISGSTYELIKAKYKCLHRGKVEAKNKGAIDMYFVEGSM